MKRRSIITISILTVISLAILLIHKQIEINNNNNQQEIISTIIYKCTTPPTKEKIGNFQSTNIITSINNKVTRYQFGYTVIYDDENLYHDMLNYLNTQTNQQFEDFENNTIYNYNDVDIPIYLKNNQINGNDTKEILSFLNNNKYTCEKE